MSEQGARMERFANVSFVYVVTVLKRGTDFIAGWVNFWFDPVFCVLMILLLMVVVDIGSVRAIYGLQQ